MIRKANVDDVRKIQRLINFYARRDLMLARSLNELYENVRDFFVYADERRIYGCCALHVDGEGLAEIKSLAVAKSRRNQGIGTRLVEVCLKEARRLKVKKVFVLTYIPEFFQRLGFTFVDKRDLPHKIWSECIRCIHFPDCGEVAMAKEI